MLTPLVKTVGQKSGTVVEKFLSTGFIPEIGKGYKSIRKVVTLPENSKLKQLGVDAFELTTLDNGFKKLSMIGSGKVIESGHIKNHYSWIKETIQNLRNFGEQGFKLARQ